METQEFSYDVFDRQTDSLIGMCRMLAVNWDDYGTTELSIDLKSLEIKASRLCAMADIDLAIQQQELTHTRMARNIELAARMEDLMDSQFCPLVNSVATLMKQGRTIEGRKWTMFPSGMTQLMPRLTDYLTQDGIDTANWNELMANTASFEKALHKKLKPAKFPGMPGIERFWILYELFALLSYLLYHFKRVAELCTTTVTDEDAGRFLQDAIQRYTESDQGAAELARYREALSFDHGGSLSLDNLAEARRLLRADVPQQLQLCFMRNIGNMEELAAGMAVTQFTTDEYLDFISVLAKWQMLTQMMDSVHHPDRQQSGLLYNEVFHTMVHDRYIDMYDLRERIRRMCGYVTHKNGWLCVWCVLYHNNLIKNTSLEAFARQMNHPDWFGKDKDIPSFSGDTLRDYKPYFTERHYTIWNVKDYNIYRELHGKTKWSPDLCDRFMRLCLQMEDAFRH